MKKKIAFAFCPLHVSYNHGIALLSELCKQAGIETELYLLRSVLQFGAYLETSGADYIGFTAVTVHDYRLSLPFMQTAKKAGKVVLFGGVYARRQGVDLSDCPADGICRGEGETLPDFILKGDAGLFREPLRCEDINTLPLPDYELFKGIPFDRRISFLDGKKVLPYYSSRGCPWSCSFCEVRLQPEGVRIRTKVGDDLSFLRENYNPDIFFIGDETLPYYSPAWRESWRDFKHPFCCYIRGDVSVSLISWLHTRGLTGCAIGIECGDEEYRNDVLKKDLADEDIFRTVGALKELGIAYVPFFMTGLPGETFAQTALTYKMAEEIGGNPVIFKYEELSPCGLIH